MAGTVRLYRHPSPSIQIRVVPDAAVAVVVARQGVRYSRMLLWELERDVIWPGQGMKGRIELLDVSPDGRYVAFAAIHRFWKVPPAIVVSRPPYLPALFYQPVEEWGPMAAWFRDAGTFEWSGVPLVWYRREGPFRKFARPGCPLEVVHRIDAGGPDPEPEFARDPRGRILRAREGRVYADNVEVLDLRALARPVYRAPSEAHRW